MNQLPRGSASTTTSRPRIDRERRVRAVPDRRLAPALIGVLVMISVVLWAQARPWDSRMVNTPAKFGAVSSLSAVLGTVLLSTTIVLSARARIVENATGGLDRTYRLHHWLGGIAFALLALHPSLLAWRYAQVSWRRAAHLWLPSTSDRALTAGQIALWTMSAAMAVTVFVHVRHQVLVWLQRLLGAAFLPAAYHVFGIGGDVDTNRPLRLYLAVVTAAGGAALLYHSVLGRWLVRHHHYRVSDIRALPGGIDDVRLEPTGPPMSFVPGQFGFLRFRDQDIGREAHPFSIASPPCGSELRFVVKELGDYTRQLLHDVRPGADAVIEGPYGRFSHRFVRGRDQVWIAGGIGIAPFLSMAGALPGSGYRAELYYCYPDEDQAPFRDELSELDATIAELTVREICDRRDGFLSATTIAANGPLENREFLLCGPPTMMHTLRDQLSDAGVSANHIHFEEFVFG